MFSSLTVIIPALNEEENLSAAVTNSLKIAKEYFQEVEILIFDDGSSDNTGMLADHLSQENSSIRVFHHLQPQNLGGCYWEGVEKAKGDYIIMVPGDNECGENVLRAMFAHADNAQIVIPYTSNQQVRPLGRQILSAAFVYLLNTISGQQLKYYNGTVLHRREIIQTVPIRTPSFAYQAEALVYLLRRGHTFIEVPVEIAQRSRGKSKALCAKNLLYTGASLARLATDSIRHAYHQQKSLPH